MMVVIGDVPSPVDNETPSLTGLIKALVAGVGAENQKKREHGGCQGKRHLGDSWKGLQDRHNNESYSLLIVMPRLHQNKLSRESDRQRESRSSEIKGFLPQGACARRKLPQQRWRHTPRARRASPKTG